LTPHNQIKVKFIDYSRSNQVASKALPAIKGMARSYRHPDHDEIRTLEYQQGRSQSKGYPEEALYLKPGADGGCGFDVAS
jgi:hypothetical protein